MGVSEILDDFLLGTPFSVAQRRLVLLIAITRLNARQFPEVRLVDEGSNAVVQIADAMARAEELGLDLVVVSPKANPPVCRIQDLKKLEYEAKKAKKVQKGGDLKEIQLKVNISDHDLQTKLSAIQKFLERGDKVKVSIRLKGRERETPERAHLLLKRVGESVPCKMSRLPGPITIAILEAAK